MPGAPVGWTTGKVIGELFGGKEVVLTPPSWEDLMDMFFTRGKPPTTPRDLSEAAKAIYEFGETYGSDIWEFMNTPPPPSTGSGDPTGEAWMQWYESQRIR